jgi:TRAP-type mannitol/chloroaromatic compound transport system permease large subunit
MLASISNQIRKETEFGGVGYNPDHSDFDYFFLRTGTWIFSGLLMVSITGVFFLFDFSVGRIGVVRSKILYSSASGWELAAIPLFMWMGENIFRTDISNRFFRGLSPLVDWLPGRLLHTNVLGCAIFTAVSGSSTATTATITALWLPEINPGQSRKK